MRRLVALGAVLAAAGAQAETLPPKLLRVCADPNNLPFSNGRREGFENKLAELTAQALGATVQYFWFPQRRGFFRNTLNAKRCDVVMGVPAALDLAATTRPYYRSSYVFVERRDRPPIRSLDDPALRALRIGVPLVGEDGENPPPLAALAARGLRDNAKGYLVTGDYTQESPPSALIAAVSRGDVDLAIAWGPLAGFYAGRATPALAVSPVPEAEAPTAQTFTFDIAMAVRKDDLALRHSLNDVLAKRRAEIAALLAAYDVPQL